MEEKIQNKESVQEIQILIKCKDELKKKMEDLRKESSNILSLLRQWKEEYIEKICGR